MSATVTIPPAAPRRTPTVNPEYRPLFSGSRSSQCCCTILGIFGLGWLIFVPLYLRKPDCSDDGFEWVRYNTTSYFNGKFEVGLKVRLLQKENGEALFFNFKDAQAACLKVKSHLWQMRDGEDEWKPVLAFVARKNLTADFKGWWLDVIKVGKCPGGKGRCEEEALQNQGAPVSWPVKALGPYFSRAAQSGTWTEECLFVDPGSHFLWKAGNCKNEPRHALCVKWDCRNEN